MCGEWSKGARTDLTPQPPFPALRSGIFDLNGKGVPLIQGDALRLSWLHLVQKQGTPLGAVGADLRVCPGRTRRRVSAPTHDPTTLSDGALSSPKQMLKGAPTDLTPRPPSLNGKGVPCGQVVQQASLVWLDSSAVNKVLMV